MSVQNTMQIGGDEPYPQAILELQQIAIGMLLVWDALGEDYHHRETAEGSALFDWARKHKVSPKTAFEALVIVKQRLRDAPWAHYLHCRDFKGEGWVNVILFSPEGNTDALTQIRSVLDRRPFKDK
jgi:hypothetical protein